MGGAHVFPGGRVDPCDTNPIDCALREAEEEVGLPPDRTQIVGRLDTYQTRTGFEIVPVVGIVRPPFTVRPDTFEVAESGTRKAIEERALPFQVGDEVLVTIEEPHMFNADDAIARVDSYIVSVTGGGSHVGERKLVRIESVERSAALASMIDGGNGAGGSGSDGGEQVKSSSSRRRRGRRGGRRRSRAKTGSSDKDS